MKLPKPLFKVKKPKKQEHLPLRVLVGTVPGTKKDAESMARSQIERYFDMPDRAWLRIKALPEEGYLYEAHEAGEGKSYLDSILGLDLEPNETIILKPGSGHAVEIIVRENKVLQSLILPEKVSKEKESDPRLKPSFKRDMQPYATTGAEWIKVGVTVIALGLLTVTVGGILHKSYDIALKGYDEIAATLPATRLLNLAERSSFPGDSIPSMKKLPISQWQRVSTMPLQSNEVVSKLYFKDGRWDIETQITGNEEEDYPPGEGFEDDPGFETSDGSTAEEKSLNKLLAEDRTRVSTTIKNGKSVTVTEYLDESGKVVGRTVDDGTGKSGARGKRGTD